MTAGAPSYHQMLDELKEELRAPAAASSTEEACTEPYVDEPAQEEQPLAPPVPEVPEQPPKPRPHYLARVMQEPHVHRYVILAAVLLLLLKFGLPLLVQQARLGMDGQLTALGLGAAVAACVGGVAGAEALLTRLL